MRRYITLAQRRRDLTMIFLLKEIAYWQRIPLHLKIIGRSVEWILEHKHPVPYWGHLTPAEIDADGEVYLGDQLSTTAEVRREWRKNHQEAWEKIWKQMHAQALP